MTRTMSATEARVHFGELMRRVVEGQEPVIVERGGKPQVVVLSVAEYERLRGEKTEPDDWWDRAKRSRERVAQELNGRPFPDITELIHDMREERDAQILGNLR